MYLLVYSQVNLLCTNKDYYYIYMFLLVIVFDAPAFNFFIDLGILPPISRIEI